LLSFASKIIATAQAPRVVETRNVGDANLLCRTPLALIGLQEGTPVAFSADGKLVAFVAKNFAIYVGSVDARKQKYAVVRVMVGHTQTVHRLLFHPSKPLLISAGIDGIYFWNYETGALLKQHVVEHDSKVIR
jgi:WD40 repeat protein